MMDRARALRPLEDAAPAIDRLDTYESPAELAEALRATWHAVDTGLRSLLRSDTAAPDEVRMKAMSRTDLPHDDLIIELRRRNVISLTLAGRIHELRQAAERAGEMAVRQADADVARDVVQRLRGELPASPRPEPAAEVRPVRAVDVVTDADETGVDDVAARRAVLPSLRRLGRGPALLVAASVLVVIIAAALVFMLGRPDDMGQGVAAFRAGNMGVAEQHFRAALQRDARNTTAQLYLGRILRAQGRRQEAADVLRAAAGASPRDPAVRRELGYLFLDLQLPDQAATQFRQAVELDPDEPLGWVALYEAQLRAEDPAAAETLRRAPAAAQAMIRTGRP